MRTRAWGWLLLAPLVVGVAVVATAPYLSFHADLVLAGTPGRFADSVVRAGRSDARSALWFDNSFAVVWLLTVPALLRAGRDRWAPGRRVTTGWWFQAPGVAVGAGVCNLVENSMALAMVGKQRPSTWLTLSLDVLGWATIALSLGAVVGVFGLVIGPLVAPVVRPSMNRLAGGGRLATAVDVDRPPARHLLVRVVAVAGLAVAVTALVSAALGRFVRTRVVHPAFPEREVIAEQLRVLDLFPGRLVLPPLVFVVLGLAIVMRRRRTDLEWLGRAMVVFGAVLAAVLVAAPVALVLGRRVLDLAPGPGGPDGPAAVVLVLAAIVVIVGVRRVLSATLDGGHLRALHVAVPAALVVVAGKVADTFAYDEAPLWTGWPIEWIDARVTLVTVALVWTVAVSVVPLHRLSPAGVGSAEPGHWGGYPRDLAVRAAAWAAQARRIAPAAPGDRALAVLGLLPGDWVPHPERGSWFADPVTAPRAHVGHLACTALGRYRPATDAFVRAVAVDEAGGVVALTTAASGATEPGRVILRGTA